MEDIQLRKGILTFKRKLKRGESYKFINNKKFTSLSIFNKPTKVNGIASYCQDGKHVLFIDYDNCAKWLVEEDYKRIQDQYDLPPAYLFTTKQDKDQNGEMFGNYHVICLVKYNPRRIYEIVSKTHADVNYVSMPLRNKYKNWILRVSNKQKRGRPEYLTVIGRMDNLYREISNPHFKFLNKIYELDKIDFQLKDKCKKIYLQEYETLNV